MRLFIAGLLAALGVVSVYRELLAHAYLVSADPPAGASLQASPEKITLLFSEEIDPRFSSFDLYSDQKHLLQKLSFTVEEQGLRVVLALPQLAPGAYTVAWKVLSAIDGHITTGVIPFGVGVTPPDTASAETELDLIRVLVRWGRLLALMVLVGMLLFMRSIIKTLEEESFSVLWGLWGLAVLFSAGELALYGTRVGEPSAVWTSRVGLTLSVQTALVLAAGMIARRAGRWTWPVLIVTTGALGAGAFSSHSAALNDLGATVSHLAHAIAGASWAGGLLALGLLLRRRDFPWGKVLPRFSRDALLSVAVLTTSGIYLAVRHVGTPEALWSTDYGRFLMLKMALLSGVLAVAALNFLHVRRHFYVGNQEQTDLELLRRRVWIELFMIALAIGGASALALSPPPNVVPLPTVLVHESNGLRVTLTISSLRVGPAHFTVQIRSHNGQPVTDHVQRVTLEFRQSDELGAVSAIAEPTSAGAFVADGVYLSVAGEWEITVRVRLSTRTEDITAVFAVEAVR